MTDAITGSITDPLSSLDSGARMAVLMSVHVVGIIWALFITAAAVYTTLARTVAVWFFSHGPNEQGKVVLKAWWSVPSRPPVARRHARSRSMRRDRAEIVCGREDAGVSGSSRSSGPVSRRTEISSHQEISPHRDLAERSHRAGCRR